MEKNRSEYYLKYKKYKEKYSQLKNLLGPELNTHLHIYLEELKCINKKLSRFGNECKKIYTLHFCTILFKYPIFQA